jgi:hypothetical protein
MAGPSAPASLSVRSRTGEVRSAGSFERVSTGAKEAFNGLEAIGQVIVRMLKGENASHTPVSTSPVTGEKTILGTRSRGESADTAATD